MQCGCVVVDVLNSIISFSLFSVSAYSLLRKKNLISLPRGKYHRIIRVSHSELTRVYSANSSPYNYENKTVRFSNVSYNKLDELFDRFFFTDFQIFYIEAISFFF